MDLGVRTEVTRGGTPEPRRVLVKSTNEVGVILDVRQSESGDLIATVFFEATGECKLYLNNRRWLEPAYPKDSGHPGARAPSEAP